MRSVLQSRMLSRLGVAAAVALVVGSVLVMAEDPTPLGENEFFAWAKWATANQRNELAADEPLNWVLHVRGHNAYASYGYGFVLDVNQAKTLRGQLEAGARVLELDLHVRHGVLIVCHNLFCDGGEFLPLHQLLGEIASWLGANPTEIVGLYLENKISEDVGGNSEPIVAALKQVDEAFRASGLGPMVLKEPLQVGTESGKPALASPIYDGTVEAATEFQRQRWPTRREMLAHGKRVFTTYIERNFSSSDPSFTSDYIWEWDSTGDQISMQSSALQFNYTGCHETGETTTFWQADADGWSDVAEARTFLQGPLEQAQEGVLEDALIAALARCNVTRVSLDFVGAKELTSPWVCDYWFGALCTRPDRRIAETVWSWRIGDFGQHGYAVLAPNDGRWTSVEPNAGNRFHFACAHPREGDPVAWTDPRGATWKVTRGVGTWDEGDALCATEFPGLVFSVPRNGWQNEQLKEALAAAQADASFVDATSLVWLKYHRNATGRWVTSPQPQIHSVEMLPLAPGADSSVRSFVTRVSNEEAFPLRAIWSFADGGSFSDESVGASTVVFGDEVWFTLQAPVAGADTIELETTVLYRPEGACGTCFGVADTLTRRFTLAGDNFVPELFIPDRNHTDLELIAGGYLLDATELFIDPDSDHWTVQVDYGDGSAPVNLTYQAHPASGGYLFTLSHLYGFGGDDYTATVTVDDGHDQTVASFHVTIPDFPVDIIDGSCSASHVTAGSGVSCVGIFNELNHETEFLAEVDFGEDPSNPDWQPVSVSVADAARLRYGFATPTHVYQNAGAFEIRVRISDDVTGPVKVFDTFTFGVRVHAVNSPPLVCPDDPGTTGCTANSAGGNVQIAPGGTITRSYRIVDPDAGDWFEGFVNYESALVGDTVNLDAREPLAIGGKRFTISHTYAEAGTYKVALNVDSRFLDPEGRETFLGTGPLTFFVTVVAPDETPPATAATLDPGANAAGWHRGPVTVRLDAADGAGGSGVREIAYGLSGAETAALTVRTSTTSISISAEGVTTLAYFARDEAGNAEEPKTLTIRIDRTPPVVSGSRSPESNPHGWVNAPVTASFTAFDALSGIDGDAAATVVVSGEGAAQSATHAFRDRAGNEAIGTVDDINIDLTRPVVTASRSPEPNAAGWNNGPVSTMFTAIDVVSGIDGAAAAEIAVTQEGANQSVSQAFRDRAGNETVATVGGISIDTTAPSLSCLATPGMLWPPDGRFATIDVSVLLDGGLSGAGGFVLVSATSSEGNADDIQGFDTGNPDTSGSLRAWRDGTAGGRTYTLTYRGTDAAGNAATCSAVVLVPHHVGQ